MGEIWNFAEKTNSFNIEYELETFKTIKRNNLIILSWYVHEIRLTFFIPYFLRFIYAKIKSSKRTMNIMSITISWGNPYLSLSSGSCGIGGMATFTWIHSVE